MLVVFPYIKMGQLQAGQEYLMDFYWNVIAI